MFQLSLILGAIQILFGMVLKAVNQTIQFWFQICSGNYRMDHPAGFNGSFSFVTGRNADGKHGALDNPGCFQLL